MHPKGIVVSIRPGECQWREIVIAAMLLASRIVGGASIGWKANKDSQILQDAEK